jgi:hypothetical protein
MGYKVDTYTRARNEVRYALMVLLAHGYHPIHDEDI